MKRVAYLLGDFPVLSETFVGNEMRALSAQGFDVMPYAFHITKEQGQPIDRPLAERARELTSVSTRTALSHWLKNPWRSLKALGFILRQHDLPKLSLARSSAQLAHLMAGQQCRHVHAHFALHTAATAIAAAKLNGISVSFVGHGFDVYARPADLALKLASSNFAVAVCQDMQQLFRSLSPKTIVHPIACGIDPDRYPYRPKPLHDTNHRLLFIGRLTEKKGLNRLLDALSLIPKTERPGLDIVGSGMLLEALQLQCELLDLTDSVQFLGPQPSEWIIEHASAYLALCAPFCEAADGDRDTGPLVVKESMALGLPVITSAFMGCKEMVNPHSGILTRPNDTLDIAEAIQTMQQLPDSERRRMLDLARHQLEKQFTVERSGKQLAAAIAGAC